MPAGVRIGVDVGTVRVGVAASDPDGVLATPVATLTRDESPARADQHEIARLCRPGDTAYLVVGLPRSLSGAEGAAARRARAYAREIAALVDPVRVRLVDERLTTVQSHRQLRDGGVPGRGHRAVVDQAAAVLILQSALDAERATGRPPGQPVTDGRKPRTKERGS
jgi:putative Holliday junction resolvase